MTLVDSIHDGNIARLEVAKDIHEKLHDCGWKEMATGEASVGAPFKRSDKTSALVPRLWNMR
jgi:hypothetical protein